MNFKVKFGFSKKFGMYFFYGNFGRVYSKNKGELETLLNAKIHQAFKLNPPNSLLIKDSNKLYRITKNSKMLTDACFMYCNKENEI